MSLGKRLFIGEAAAADAACSTDTVDIFGDGSGVALYSLDYDASDAGGNYDGTYNTSNVTFGVDGKINWGASFNGNINSGIVTGITSLTNDFTISMWLNLESISINTWIFSNWDSTSQDMYFAVHPNGQLELTIDGRTGTNIFGSSGTFTLNTWHHFLVTMSNGTYDLYFNGTQLGSSGTTTNTTFNSGSNYEIGNSPRTSSGYSAWNGKIDQVRIFNKALSSSEVSTLYEETACVYTSTTDTVDYQGTNLAYYKLDGNALDETSNNYDGTESNITYEFGRFGTAAVFNGSSSKITLPSGSPFNDSDTIKCISAWIKPNTTTSNVYIFSMSSTTESKDYFTFDWIQSSWTGVPDLRVRVQNGGSSNRLDATVGVSATDNWVHVVAQLGSSEVELYINGVKQTVTHTTSGNATNSWWISNINYDTAETGLIGQYRYVSGLNADGTIDQVRIYDSALDATAVANLYAEKQAYITKDGSDPFGDNSEISFYDFESNAGNTSQDATGNNDAYFTSGVTFTSGSGLFGTYAAYLNGTSGYIQYNVLAGITTDYSFSLWAIPHASNNFNFISTEANTSVTTNLIRFSLHQNGNYYFEFGNTSSGRMTGATPSEWRDGNWHHFTWVSSSTEKHVYVDGSLYRSMSSTSGVSNLSTVTMGYYGTNYANGYYDQVRVFDRALDGDEVFKLYAEVIN